MQDGLARPLVRVRPSRVRPAQGLGLCWLAEVECRLPTAPTVHGVRGPTVGDGPARSS